MLGINSQSLPPGVAQQLKAHFIAGWGGVPVVGTKEQIVDKLGDYDEARVRRRHPVVGEVHRGHARVSEATTYPLLVQAGLR